MELSVEQKILRLVAACLKWLEACLGSRACPGVHPFEYLRFEIACPLGCPKKLQNLLLLLLLLASLAALLAQMLQSLALCWLWHYWLIHVHHL
jgi:hypothetical protein